LDWIVQCFTSPPTQYRLYNCKQPLLQNCIIPNIPIRQESFKLAIRQIFNSPKTVDIRNSVEFDTELCHISKTYGMQTSRASQYLQQTAPCQYVILSAHHSSNHHHDFLHTKTVYKADTNCNYILARPQQV